MDLITLQTYLMGRDEVYPLTPVLKDNAINLLTRVNRFLSRYPARFPARLLSSGYRPGHFNKDAHGATDSPHPLCEAIDIHDRDKAIKHWCANLDTLDWMEECGLYQEMPERTPGWVHLQTRRPRTGHRVFDP